MWTIIILVLFVIAGVIGLAVALRAKPHRRDGVVRDDGAFDATGDHGPGGDAD